MSSVALRNAALLGLCAGLGACGGGGDGNARADAAVDCSTETRDDTYAVGLEKVSGEYVVRLMDSAPAPPAKGDNTWTLQVLGPDDAPIEGATLDVTPFMPDHGHGTPKRAESADMGEGMYEVEPVNLWMPGLWEITIELENVVADEEAPSVVYSFCIDG